MQNGQFKCPICGSTHFYHVIPKTHKEVFGIGCNKCVKYFAWLDKELYNSWRRGFVTMDHLTVSKDTKDYIKLCDYLMSKGFRKITATTFVNDEYRIKLDKGVAYNKDTNEKIKLRDFLKTL